MSVVEPDFSCIQGPHVVEENLSTVSLQESAADFLAATTWCSENYFSNVWASLRFIRQLNQLEFI